MISELVQSRRYAAAFTIALLGSLLGGMGAAGLVTLLSRSLNAGPRDLAGSAVLLFAAAAVTLGLQWCGELGFAHVRHAALATLRERTALQIAALPYRDLDAASRARLSTALTCDVTALAALFSALPRLATQGTLLLGCLTYLASLSSVAFLLVLSMVVLGSLGQRRARRRADLRLRWARGEEDALFARFRELFEGAKELRLHPSRRAAFLEEELTPHVHAVERYQTDGSIQHAAADIWGNFLFFSAIGGVLFLLSPWLATRRDQETGYTCVLLYMMYPMDQVMRNLPLLGRAHVARERLQELGITLPSWGSPRPSRPPHAAPPRAPVEDAGRRFEVVLRGVTHRYHRHGEEGTFRLGPIDFTLRAGEVAFLIGGNGSGKTTLAKLIVGLYEPETGDVSCGGRPGSSSKREAHRQNFSAVFSDFHVFDSLLGLEPQRLDERARELLEVLNLHHAVQVKDGAFSTTALSSGQRKRLALLVALLEDRPAYVFDEWTADQDPEHRSFFYERLLPQLRARGKAVLVITHDDDYLGYADRCWRLEAGQLEELERDH